MWGQKEIALLIWLTSSVFLIGAIIVGKSSNKKEYILVVVLTMIIALKNYIS